MSAGSPGRRYRGAVDVVVRGLRQALLVLLATAAVALAVAGLWSALQGSGFVRTFALTLLVAGALVGLTSGAVFTRAQDHEHGRRPGVEDHDSGVLTGLGVFLFVSLPLVVAGAVLFSAA